ncbi:alanyl-tRNA editing protein [Candidatus Woesearchaeota archaeon]|nr:alanyl-tRNA editing protein [Candidatus Woesearchaeota archaeon]
MADQDKALYMRNNYLKDFEAVVESVNDDKYVVLSQTAFYPKGGGVACDTGKLIRSDSEEFPVVFVGKFDGMISHEVSKPGLQAGDRVKGFIDWDRRYKLMRYHTSAHLVSGIFNKENGALITGNDLTIEQGRIDLNLENFDRELIVKQFAKANELIQQGMPIKVYFMTKEEAMQKPEFFKLAKGMPDVKGDIRIVDIGGYDIQADGGPHVDDLKEVKGVEFLKAENKGKNNKRIYYRLVD